MAQHGRRELSFKRERNQNGSFIKSTDQSIISFFDRTPPPKASQDVVCPHFYELKWAWGCPYDCAWCYLKGTFRYHLEDGKVKPHFKARNKIADHVKSFLERMNDPTILNTGELADSLMAEGSSEPFSEFIMPFFQGTKHKVLFLTKGANVKHFLENPEWAENAILSWSLNAIPVAERWEVLAPSVLERIEAARKVSKAGFTVRIRVDPIVPVPDMKKDYHNLFNLIFNNFKPERITLGSLRGLTSTVNNVKDRSWLTYLSERSGWGLKPSHRVRMEIYKLLIEYLSEYDFYEVGLCKETLAVWDDLAMDWKNNKCNCIF